MSDNGAERLKVCRGCASGDLTVVLDLGRQPACDHFPASADPGPDPRWPLALALCGDCALVQLDHVSPVPEEPLAVESATLQQHAVEASERLLQRMPYPRGVRVREFASRHGGSWGSALVAAGCQLVEHDADLVIDNQSIIHAEDLEAELATRVAALADDGVLAIEFHHALRQLIDAQFDTVRHGHPLYFSLHSWAAACRRHGLTVVDAWAEDVFGGCLVALARRGNHEPTDNVKKILNLEMKAEATTTAGYEHLTARTARTVGELRDYLEQTQAAGHTIAAYGAGSKAVTFLGVAGIDSESIPLVADLSPSKQGRRVPGTSIQIVSPADLITARPDVVLILTWDIAGEVVEQLRTAGLDARYVVPMPSLRQVG